jgi:hypothetical protein
MWLTAAAYFQPLLPNALPRKDGLFADYESTPTAHRTVAVV